MCRYQGPPDNLQRLLCIAYSRAWLLLLPSDSIVPAGCGTPGSCCIQPAHPKHPESLLHRALVEQSGFFSLGLGQFDAIADSTAFKHGLDGVDAKCPEACLPRKETAQSGALIAAGARQCNVGEIVCFGDSDLRIRGDQLLLRLADVRAALKQR